MKEKSDLRLRQMRFSDLPASLLLDMESMERPWSESVWRDELKSPFSLYLVIEEGEEIVAHIGVKRIMEELHIMTVAVSPGYRRRGYARALITAALSAPVNAGARSVYLEVRPSNTAARALYESLGFKATGVRPRYYGDEDAILMTRDL